MADVRVLSEGVLVTYMKVEKADGRVLYYKVEGDQNIEITESEYEEANG